MMVTSAFEIRLINEDEHADAELQEIECSPSTNKEREVEQFNGAIQSQQRNAT